MPPTIPGRVYPASLYTQPMLQHGTAVDGAVVNDSYSRVVEESRAIPGVRGPFSSLRITLFLRETGAF